MSELTIESVCEKAVRQINAGVDPDDAIGEALSIWGLHCLNLSLDRANRVFDILEGVKSIHPFALNERTHAGQSVIVYHHGYWVCPTLEGQPVHFENRITAIEWVLEHGADYSAMDCARRFEPGSSFTVYDGPKDVAR